MKKTIVSVFIVLVLALGFFGFTISFNHPISVSVTCESEKVDGPAIGPLPHAVITITENTVMKDQWIGIVGPKGSNLVSYIAETSKGEEMVFDGWVGNMTGGQLMILDPGMYSVLVFVHPRESGQPSFKEDDLKYSHTFEIRSCN
jgi:hypothetical protein